MKWFIPFFIFLLLVGTACAIPTTLPVTAVGNNNVTFNSAGCSVACWFQYGQATNALNVWTPTTSTGTYTERGSPLQTSTNYFVAACDSTGCGSPVSFTTSAVVPMPTTTLGYAIDNMTESKYDILIISYDVLYPYAWLFPASAMTTAIEIICVLFFFFIFVGYWYRQRSVGGPVIIGLLISSSLLFSNRGLNLGIPVEFQVIAQALLYASLAGVLLTFLKR